MKIKIGDLVQANHNDSYLLDVGIVIEIKREKRLQTKIKIFWQKAKIFSPWLRPGLFRRLKQETYPDGGRTP